MTAFPSGRRHDMLCFVRKSEFACQDINGGLVVRFVCDFIDEVAIFYGSVRSDDNDGTGEQSGQRSVNEHHTIFLTKHRRPECGSRNDILKPFDCAEAGHGEWQIF